MWRRPRARQLIEGARSRIGNLPVTAQRPVIMTPQPKTIVCVGTEGWQDPRVATRSQPLFAQRLVRLIHTAGWHAFRLRLPAPITRRQAIGRAGPCVMRPGAAGQLSGSSMQFAGWNDSAPIPAFFEAEEIAPSEIAATRDRNQQAESGKGADGIGGEQQTHALRKANHGNQKFEPGLNFLFQALGGFGGFAAYCQHRFIQNRVDGFEGHAFVLSGAMMPSRAVLVEVHCVPFSFHIQS
jgi:hypothetical protein